VEHWPDPEVFIQYPHKQKYSGEECRNPNRAYPGRLNGTFAERVAFGIQQLVRMEKVDMLVDLHEGQPEYPFINAISRSSSSPGSGYPGDHGNADV
jgi:predicted deacylase